MVIQFQLMHWSLFMKVHRELYFIGHITLFVGVLFVTFAPKVKRHKPNPQGPTEAPTSAPAKDSKKTQ